MLMLWYVIAISRDRQPISSLFLPGPNPALTLQAFFCDVGASSDRRTGEFWDIANGKVCGYSFMTDSETLVSDILGYS